MVLHRYKQSRKRLLLLFDEFCVRSRALRFCLCRSSTTDARGVPQATGKMPVPQQTLAAYRQTTGWKCKMPVPRLPDVDEISRIQASNFFVSRGWGAAA